MCTFHRTFAYANIAYQFGGGRKTYIVTRAHRGKLRVFFHEHANYWEKMANVDSISYELLLFSSAMRMDCSGCRSIHRCYRSSSSIGVCICWTFIVSCATFCAGEFYSCCSHFCIVHENLLSRFVCDAHKVQFAEKQWKSRYTHLHTSAASPHSQNTHTCVHKLRCRRHPPNVQQCC